MKKVLVLILGMLCLFSCGNDNSGNGKTVVKKNSYKKETVDWGKQFKIANSLDTTQTTNIDVKVLQTIGETECLAITCSNKQYGWYNGDIVYYISNDLLYDDKIIKDKVYFIGTYTYTTRNEMQKTVPVYWSAKNDRTFLNNVISIIKDINENY